MIGHPPDLKHVMVTGHLPNFILPHLWVPRLSHVFRQRLLLASWSEGATSNLFPGPTLPQNSRSTPAGVTWRLASPKSNGVSRCSNKVFQALGGSVVPPSKLHFSSPSISSARARPDFSSVKNFCLKSHVLPGEKTPICPWACSTTSQAHACANGRVTGPWSTCFILIPELMLFPLAGLKQDRKSVV